MAELNTAGITTPLDNASLDGNPLDSTALDRTSEDESSLLLRRRLFEHRFAARFVTRGISLNATGIKPDDFVALSGDVTAGDVTAGDATDLDATVAVLAPECSAFPLPSTALPSTPLNPDLSNLPNLLNASNLPDALARGLRALISIAWHLTALHLTVLEPIALDLTVLGLTPPGLFSPVLTSLLLSHPYIDTASEHPNGVHRSPLGAAL